MVAMAVSRLNELRSELISVGSVNEIRLMSHESLGTVQTKTSNAFDSTAEMIISIKCRNTDQTCEGITSHCSCQMREI
jgi:hypothetical protein